MTKPVTMLTFLRHRIDSEEWGARFFGADEAGHSVARAVREATTYGPRSPRYCGRSVARPRSPAVMPRGRRSE